MAGRFDNLNERIGYLEKVVSILLEDASEETKAKLNLITKDVQSEYNFDNPGFVEVTE
tara:strand:+ start:1124 stop:1297 length:174 start_codon:yes stop_codon:yes gene_type:complete